MLGAEQDPKHVTLPPPRERDWLIAQTAELLGASRHVAAYLRGPLIEATPEYFPDRWAGGEASVRRIILRLLRYAGDPDCDAEVVIHDEDPARRGEVVAKPPPMRGKDPMAWFVRQASDGTLHFACEQAILREPENLVPTLARAVAHAHRVVLGLDEPDNARKVDVTGVVLGFGLLTVDAAQRFYSRSAGGFRSTRAEFRLGALSVQDMSFLLAIQLESRALNRRARRRLLAHLQPNQAGFVREAQSWLARQSPSIRARLGLPEPNAWPPTPDLDALLGPLADPRYANPDAGSITGSGVFDPPDAHEGEADDDDEFDDDDDDDEPRRDIDRGIRDANRGKPVFRIERSGALRMAKILGFPVLMLGGLLSRGNYGVDIPMQIVAPVAVGLAVLGLAVGSLFTDRRCSEPKCGVKLSADDEVCPLCGGVIMGVIHHPRERLGAEEELQRKRKISPEGLVAGWEDDDDDDDEHEHDVDESEDDEVEAEEEQSPAPRA